MSQDSRKLRFDLWYDFRNPSQWHQSPDRLYAETLDQIAWAENHGFDDVWLSEHHFIEDGYLPSILPVAAAIAARTKRIRIASGVLLMPFHNPGRNCGGTSRSPRSVISPRSPGCSRERMIAMRTVAPSGIDVRGPKFLRRNRPDEVRDAARIRVGTARARRSACS